MEYKTLKTNFQRELLFFIILNMRRGKITKKNAKLIAKIVTPFFKNENIDEFLKGIEKACKYSPEITEAFIKTVREYEKATLKGKITMVRNSINQDQSFSSIQK